MHVMLVHRGCVGADQQEGVRLATTRLGELSASRDDVTVECYYYDTLPTWRVIAPEPSVFVSSVGADVEGHRSPMYRLGRTRSGGALYLGFRRFVDEQRRTARRVL